MAKRLEERPTGRVRNVVLVGGGGSGKTTLAEALMGTPGRAGTANPDGAATNGRGAVLDSEPEEQARQHTLFTAFGSFEWRGHRINIIDTPGTPDFVGDAYPALIGADTAIFVLDAVDGITAVHEQLWAACEELSLPRMVFLNMLDKPRAGYQRHIDALRARYGKPLAPVLMPMGVEEEFDGVIDLLHNVAVRKVDGARVEEAIPPNRLEQAEQNRTSLIEAIVEVDDDLLMRYLEGDVPEPKELAECFEHGIRDQEFFPVLCGSASQHIGVRLLADFIVEETPSLDERRDVSGPASAVVLKTISDPYVGHINVLRLMSGAIATDDIMKNPRTGASVRLHQLFGLQGATQVPKPNTAAGDIVAVAKIDDLRTGDVLLAEGAELDLPELRPPAGTHRIAIQALSNSDEDKLTPSLQRLQEEDPSLVVISDPATHQLVLQGNGPLHLQTVIALLERKFGVHVEEIPLRLRYLETITSSANGLGRLVKQTGGAGQFAICHVEVRPNARGEGFTFEDNIVGGVIPREYIGSVEKGVRAAMERGVLAGYELVDLHCRLFDGKTHSVDSKPHSFEVAGGLALQDAVRQAGMILLEPVTSIEVTVPDDMIGDVMGDLSSRRGRIEGTHAAGIGRTMVTAAVPEAELLTYTGDLRSLTGGQGTVTMSYSHHQECPSNIAEAVIAAAQED